MTLFRSILLELLLITALFEQTFLAPDSTILFAIAAVLFAAMAIVVTGLLRAPLLEPATGFFPVSVSALIAFHFADALSLHQHYALRGEQFNLLGYNELMGALVLCSLIWHSLSCKQLPFAERLIQAGSASAGLIFIVYCLLSADLRPQFSSVHIVKAEEIPTGLFLAGTYLLVLARFALGRGAIAKPVLIIDRVLLASAAVFVAWLMWMSVYRITQTEIAGESINLRHNQKLIVYLLTAEDPIFFKHFGVDASRIKAAVKEFYEYGEYRRGGSTISMQLSKILWLDFGKSIFRKFDQIVTALVLEGFYSKRRILQAYLGSAAFAPDVTGIEQAARRYYGVDWGDLDENQALSLVLTIFDPGKFNPALISVDRDVRIRAGTIRGRSHIFEKALRAQLESALDN